MMVCDLSNTALSTIAEFMAGKKMEITYEMEQYIYKAMDERIKKAYPETGGNLLLRNKIMTATIESLKKQKESVLSLALFYAAEEANKDKEAE